MADDDFEGCAGCCAFLLWLYALVVDITLFIPEVGGWEWIIYAVAGAICTGIGLASLGNSIDENSSIYKYIMLVVLYIIIIIAILDNPEFKSSFSFDESIFWYVIALIFSSIIPFIIAGGFAVWIWDHLAAFLTDILPTPSDDYEVYTPRRTREPPHTPSGDDELEVYSVSVTQFDTPAGVIAVPDINDVGEHAKCPICSNNIRDTFYENGGIVKCTACDVFYHKKCFDDVGQCESKACKFRRT